LTFANLFSRVGLRSFILSNFPVVKDKLKITLISNMIVSGPNRRLVRLACFLSIVASLVGRCSSSDLLSKTFKGRRHQQVIRSLQEGNVQSESSETEDIQGQIQDDAKGELRDLLAQVRVPLPDSKTQQSTPLGKLTLDVFDFECYDFYYGALIGNTTIYSLVGGAALPSSSVSEASRVLMDFGVEDFKLSCDLSFRWAIAAAFGNIKGSGSLTIHSDENDLGAEFQIESSEPGFSFASTQEVTMNRCNSEIGIDDLDFSGDIAAQAANLVEDAVLRAVEDQINPAICEAVTESGDDAIESILESVSDSLEELREPFPAWRLDPMYAEKNFELEDGSDPFRFNLTDKNEDEDGLVGKFFFETNERFSNYTTDINAPNGNGMDLGINTIIRDSLMGGKETYLINLTEPDSEDISFSFPENDFFEGAITLQFLEIIGLDSFEIFEPFGSVGNYTIQNELKLKHLSMELDFRVNISASRAESSYFTNPEAITPVISDFHVEVGLDDLYASVSLFLVLDPLDFLNLPLGAFFSTTNIIPCVMNEFTDIGLSDLNLTIGSVDTPVITGIFDNDIDKSVESILDASFSLFETRVLELLPQISQGIIRDGINETLKSVECNIRKVEGTIDFRDLLLDPDEAKEMGGTDKSPYGNLVPMLAGIVDEQLSAVEDDGSLSLNENIRELTETQSGQEGEIIFDLPNMDILIGDPEVNFEFEMQKVVIKNVDSLVKPISLFRATEHPHVLQNEIRFDPVAENEMLTVSTRLSFSLWGTQILSPVKNKVDIIASASSIGLFAELFAMVSAPELFNFPIESYNSTDCLLALLVGSPDDEVTKRVGIERFLLNISDFNIEMKCLECESGFTALSDVAEIYDRNGVTKGVAGILPFLINDVIVSDTWGELLTEQLRNAPYSCEHRSEYDANYEPPEMEIPSLPTALSREANEALFYSTISFAMVGIIVMAETYTNVAILKPEGEFNGPEKFDIPKGVNLMDFRDMDEFLFRNANETIGNFRNSLSKVKIDEETGIEDLAVNHMFRDMADSDGYVVYEPEEPLELPLGIMTLNVHKFRIKGLDQFESISFLEPIDGQTLDLSFHLRHFELELNVTVGSSTEPQTFDIKLSMEDVKLAVLLYIGIDLDVWKELQLGKFLIMDNILPCLSSAVYGIHFPRMDFSLGSFDPPQFNGFTEPLGSSLQSAILELNSRFEDSILSTFPLITGDTIRRQINNAISEAVFEKDCGSPPALLDLEASYLEPGTSSVDLRDLLLAPEEAERLGGTSDERYGDIIHSFISLVTDQLYTSDSSGNMTFINNAMGPLLKEQSGQDEGTLVFMESQIETGEGNRDYFVEWCISGACYNFTFFQGDGKFTNLNTLVEPLQIMDNMEGSPYSLKTHIEFAEPLRVSINTFSHLYSNSYAGDSAWNNDFIFALEFYNASIDFDVYMRILEARMLAYPVSEIFEFPCLFTMIPGPETDASGNYIEGTESLKIENSTFTFDEARFIVECISCTSSALHKASISLSTDRGIKKVTNIMTNLANDWIPALGEAMQFPINTFLNDNEKQCKNHPRYIPPGVEDEMKATLPAELYSGSSTSPESQNIALAVVVALFSCCIFSCFRRCFLKRRYRKYLDKTPRDELKKKQEQQKLDAEFDATQDNMSKSMFRSDDLSTFLKYFVPFFLVVNIGFFVSGHMDVAGELGFYFKIFAEEIAIPVLIPFRVIETIRGFWQLGIYPMSVILFATSVFWPYLKQTLTLVCWFAPTKYLPMKKRMSTLLWLDYLAKWSMVDIFQLIFFALMFRISGRNPESGVLPTDFISVEMTLTLRWGLFANMSAQLMSQITSHIVIYYNHMLLRVAEEKAIHALHETSGDASPQHWTEVQSVTEKAETSRLCDMSYIRPHKPGSRKLSARRCLNVMILSSSILISVFIIAGVFFLPNVSVERRGVIGGLMAWDSDEQISKDYYSLFGIVQALRYQARVFAEDTKAQVGCATYSALLIICCCIVPVTEAMLLSVMWFKRMTRKQRTLLYETIEMLEAWQYADVYLLALVFANWQMRPLTVAVFRFFCIFYENFIELGYQNDVIEEEDANCLRVDTSLHLGAYSLFLGSLFLKKLSDFVNQAYLQTIYEREIAGKEIIYALRKRKEKKIKEIKEKDLVDYDVDDDDSDECDYTGMTADEKKKEIRSIKLPPAMFTDRFRWFLRLGEDNDNMAYSSSKAVERLDVKVKDGVDSEPHSSETTSLYEILSI